MASNVENVSIWWRHLDLPCIFNTMVADALATQRASASAAIVMTKSYWNIPVSAPEGSTLQRLDPQFWIISSGPEIIDSCRNMEETSLSEWVMKFDGLSQTWGTLHICGKYNLILCHLLKSATYLPQRFLCWALRNMMPLPRTDCWFIGD